MEIYLIRHGETENNRANRLNGRRVDTPLTPKGRQVAKEAGQRLARIPFDAVYTSSQGRAQRTAEIILAQNQTAAAGKAVQPRSAFDEIDFGTWDGKQIEEFAKTPDFKLLRERPDEYDPASYEGEAYADLILRGMKGLRTIIEETADDAAKLLVVSHGVWIMSIAKTLQGKALRDIREEGIVPNASVTLLEIAADRQTIQVKKFGE